MNGGFGPGLGISSSPLMSRGYSHSTNRLNIHRSHTLSHESHQSDRIQPHPSHYGPPRPHRYPGLVGTIAPDKHKWMIPLCHEPENDSKTCCLGFWCPQILYGRTQFRLRQMAQRKDPLDLTDYKVTNGPCTTFMLVEYATAFSWILIMLQHSRIRATYNIDGTTADDCCSAYCCPCCTAMQDDREIRAREYENGKNEKRRDVVNDQPSTQPDMHYAAPNLLDDEPVQHRGSLVREKPAAVTNWQGHSSGGHFPKGQNLGLEHSQNRHTHKKLHRVPTVDTNGHEIDEKGEMAHHNHQRDFAKNGITCVSPSAYPDYEERDAILASRQKWRRQNLFGEQGGGTEHGLANNHRDGARGSENLPVTKCRTLYDYSEDATISQVRGKRVLKQISKKEDPTARSTMSDPSESLADESVLVFYEDGERPQRHILADCTRLRVSSLGRTDTSHHNNLPASWWEEETVVCNGQSKPSSIRDLAAGPEAVVPEVVVTEAPEPLDQQHIINDLAVGDIIETKDVKQHQCGSHLHENCTADAGTTNCEANEPAIRNPSLVEQHLLDKCIIDTVPDTAIQKPLEKTSQHSLSQCGEEAIESVSVESDKLERHGIADCAIIDDAQTVERPPLAQHVLNDCDVVVDGTRSESSEDMYSANENPTSKQAAEQSDDQSATFPVPQPPIVIVTTCEVLEEATGEQQEQNRSASPEITEDLVTSARHQAGPSNPTRGHDGTTDIKAGQQQLSEAAAALSKILRAAADMRHGKTTTDFKGNDPTEVNADGSPKMSSHGFRTKAIGGRALRKEARGSEV